MLKTNFLTYFSEIIIEFIFKILYFPIWWYGPGAILKAKKCCDFLKDKQEDLGLFIWAKNILVPMFGEEDFAGRMISFFIRLAQVIARALLMLFWVIVSLLKLLLWLFFPLILLFLLIFQIL